MGRVWILEGEDGEFLDGFCIVEVEEVELDSAERVEQLRGRRWGGKGKEVREKEGENLKSSFTYSPYPMCKAGSECYYVPQ